MSVKKSQPIWVCSDCGEEATTWAGRCAKCGEWNTLKEVRLPTVTRGGSRSRTQTDLPEVVSLIKRQTQDLPVRLPTEINEVDRVLGGGFFPGSVVLIAGEPGIGKSTLLLTVAHHISQKQSVLYISGEESTFQIEHRAGRLGLIPSNIRLATTTDLGELFALLEKEKPAFVVIDSIQTLADSSYPSPAGSVVQVRETALSLQRWAKTTNSTLLLVGHVTKEGVVAGPRTLEHLVDVVLTMEGERLSDLRLVRSQKNRFGPTDEVGILAMTGAGMTEVVNPSARFLGEREERVPGSVVTVVLEGTRPFLVEIQALTRPTHMSFPRRTASGFDLGRLELLIAVLEARAGVRLDKLDCYLNVSGGLRVREPAADLAVLLAVASAATGRVLAKNLVAYGEVGLAGEIRPVVQGERRLEEAKRLGFTNPVNAKTVRAALEQVGISKFTEK